MSSVRRSRIIQHRQGWQRQRPSGCGWTGLVAQPLALSLSKVNVLEAQTHAADVACEEGWIVPDQLWKGVAVAARLGYALLLRMDVPSGIPAIPEESSCETPAVHDGRWPFWPHAACASLDQTALLPHGAHGHPQPTCVCHAHVVSSLVRSLVKGTTRSEERREDGSGPEKL
jgi:hypothetical protein